MSAGQPPLTSTDVKAGDVALATVVEQINQPEHQGVPLLAKDYVALIVATIVVPIAITIWAVAVA